MTDILANLKQHTFAIFGAGTSIGTAITASQEQLEWRVKMCCYGISAFVGILTAINIIRNWEKKKQ